MYCTVNGPRRPALHELLTTLDGEFELGEVGTTYLTSSTGLLGISNHSQVATNPDIFDK